jgi:hypothetical protein
MPEGRISLEGPRHMCENNIKINLRKIGIDVANWFRLARIRVKLTALVDPVMNLQAA